MQAAEHALGGAELRASPRWRGHALAALVLLTALVRVWVILHYPEPDGDAKGHLGIAEALRSHPFRVALHWVWPPGYHYLLAALLSAGFTADGVRLLNCGFATLLPLFVWRYCYRTLPVAPSVAQQRVPFLAALLCAVMPVVNVVGTSAEPGTLFALLVLVTALCIDTGEFIWAGSALAVAAMIRYEAWGAIGLLAALRVVGLLPRVVARLPPTLARVCHLPFVVTVPSLAAVFLWFLAHRLADGTWFGFVRELYRYSRVQREVIQQDLLWFPVMQPYYLFGLAIPPFALGLRRAWRPGFVVPLGIYLFLLVSVTFKGTLGSARYYDSLTPFVCVGAAYGTLVLRRLWAPAGPLAFAAVFAHVVRLLVQLDVWTFHFGRR